jgi:hypothetical protein
MNERIKQLAEQANIKYDAPNDVYYNDSYDGIRRAWLEKFAELIVKECFYCVEIMEKIAHASNADIPPDYDRQTYLKTLEAVTGLMKSHFGVE